MEDQKLDRTNIVIGSNAGLCLTTGHHNILIGHDAGRNFTTESYMLIFGGIRHQMSGDDEYYSYVALLETVINSYRRYATAQNIIPYSTGSNSTVLGEGSYHITLGYAEYMKSPGNKVIGMFSIGETTTGSTSGPWGTAQGIAGDNAHYNTIIGIKPNENITSASNTIIYGKLTPGNSSVAIGKESMKLYKKYCPYIAGVDGVALGSVSITNTPGAENTPFKSMMEEWKNCKCGADICAKDSFPKRCDCSGPCNTNTCMGKRAMGL